MQSHSKRYQEAKAKVDPKISYLLDEAITLVKSTANTKFDSTVEVHVRLGIDPKKGEQQIRSTVNLPHGTGKTKKIAAFVSENNEKEAREAGADFIFGEADIQNLKQTGKIAFDVAIATPEMMPKIAQLAKILGPRGLMPNPKTETVTTKVKETIEGLKKGKATFKNDDTGNVHQAIGKVSFSNEQLKENFETFFEVLRKVKPASAKGIYVQNVTLTSTMGPGIKVAITA